MCDGQLSSSGPSEQPLDLPPPGLQSTDDQQTVRHVLLCLLLSVSLLANLSSCLWWLFNKDPGRLYLELQFFCAVANYGQGFLSFGIFGLDRHLIILPFKKRFLSLWHGRDGEDLSQSAVPEEVRLTCTQFVRYHKDQCVQDIVHTRRFGGLTQEETAVGRCLSHHPQYLITNPSDQDQRLNESQNLHQNPHPDESRKQTSLPSYQEAQDEHQGYVSAPPLHLESVFLGSDLVDWLIERGLCAGQTEARLYGVRLQRGGVLSPLDGQQNFRDEPTLFYHFTQEDRWSRST
uniref:DEP domain-containing protein n=2 Tax=Cyprinodon variegatus TaxID=28743 RepID=A0A3Q2CHG1_CYPVA